MPETETVKEWLQGLADTNTSSEQDSAKIQNLLRRVGFSRAVVVVGIVYLEGRGTIDAPPTSINSVAKMILEIGAQSEGGD